MEKPGEYPALLPYERDEIQTLAGCRYRAPGEARVLPAIAVQTGQEQIDTQIAEYGGGKADYR
jgi:hypothetical protein